MMNPDEISKLAFLLYPHIVKAQPDAATIESLAARVKELQTGLLPEDEFATIVCRLGNCAGIHRIGQAPMPLPDLPDKMRAPDFIAFPIVDGRPFPVLIEVKSSRHQKIKWSERYRRSLANFAEHLKLPLLVARRLSGVNGTEDLWRTSRNISNCRFSSRGSVVISGSSLITGNLSAVSPAIGSLWSKHFEKISRAFCSGISAFK